MAAEMKLKLLVNTATNTVLFAEASKEVVDFLFGLLVMPIGSIVKLLSQKYICGALGNIFASVQAMDATYLQSRLVRDALLNPVVHRSVAPAYDPLFLFHPKTVTPASAPSGYFRCTNVDKLRCRLYICNASRVTCPSCTNVMTGEATMVEASAAVDSKTKKGYVKEVVTYAIMDDLSVTPMSSISSITMLNKFNVTDVGVLEETTVKLGICKRLELLKASLHSKTVLSDVFLAAAPNKSAKKRKKNSSDTTLPSMHTCAKLC